MNMYTEEIMKLLKVDAKTAIQIQDKTNIHFSTCTTAQFNSEAKRIAKVLGFLK